MTAAPTRRRGLDRYELLAEIASGGMGSVLLARLGGVGGFQRLFAIKVMHPHLVENPQFIAMLLDEARLAARIHHPNVVATVDVRNSGSFYYVVMDYVDGFQLTRVLEDAPFAPRDRIRIANRMLLDAMFGLEAAHNLRGDDSVPLGIVHRDVSPQNILVGTDGVGRLTDFGIALAASRITASRPGMIKGKPAYLSPEQARAQLVDRRADVWALGVILWEALTGARLFSGESEAATVLKVVSEPIALPSTVNPAIPPELEGVCLRALSRDPTQRFRTAREMALELERASERAELLADTHEVADLVRERFGVEIEARRVAIQRYIAALGPDTEQALIGDLYTLPKLFEDAPALAPTAQKSQAHAVAGSPVYLSAGASPGTPQPAAQAAASSPERTTAMNAASEKSPAKPRRVAGVFALLGLLVVGSLVTLVLLRPRATPSPEPEEVGAPVAAARTNVSAAQPEASRAPPPAVTPIAPVVEPSAEPLPKQAAAAVRRPDAAPGKQPRPAPQSAAQPPKPGERRPEPPKASGSDTGVPIEENPYRFR